MPCRNCGKPFTRHRSAGKPQVHCSDECRRAFATSAARRRFRESLQVSCDECGERIQQPERGRPRRFCTDTCKRRAMSRQVRRSQAPLRQADPDSRVCPVCNTVFTPRRRDRLYCYDGNCAQTAYQRRKARGEAARVVATERQCGECGSAFTSIRPEARWCSTTCANRHHGRVRSRGRGFRDAGTYIDRAIFERDGWRCYLCGEPVARDVARTHPDGPTIDHVVPLSRGGTDSPDNVATAHWRCNRDKGDRRVAVGIAQPTYPPAQEE